MPRPIIPVHELIAARWSPRAFADRPVEREKLLSVLEAARWAASSYNGQPWRFLLATKAEPEEYERLLTCLIPFNQQWAKAAPMLLVSLAKKDFDHNGQPNAHFFHDVGQATANMALQATALGLQVHQMAGFDGDKVRQGYGVPDEFAPVAAIALGYPGDPEMLPENFKERELAPRNRRPVEEFAFVGAWGQVGTVLLEK